MARFLYFVPLGLFAVLAIYFAQGLNRDPGYMPSMLIDRPVPEFDLSPIAGYDVGLSSETFKGRVSLLNVFGSWCVSCNIEHPVLLAIEEEGVVPIFGLNWKDKPGDGTAWLEAKGDPYALIGDDEAGRVAIDLGVTGAPETFVIDAEGRVRHKHVGPISAEDWEFVLKPMVRDLQKGNARAAS